MTPRRPEPTIPGCAGIDRAWPAPRPGLHERDAEPLPGAVLAGEDRRQRGPVVSRGGVLYYGAVAERMAPRRT